MSSFADVPALLLIAHGTRDPRGAAEMDVLTGVLRSRHRAPVTAAWLEDFADPGVSEAVDTLAGQGVRRVVSVPLLQLGAGHAKTDVPGELASARAAHPEMTFVHARVLGLHPALFTLARTRVAAARATAWSETAGPPGDDEALVVAASGSSDPDANGDLAKATRFLAEQTGHRWAEHAFAGVTWPRTDVVLSRLAAAGATRVVLFGWSLLAGLLEQRVAAAADAASKRTGLQVVMAGRFGPDPLVADVVVDRYHEALHGDARMNCDLCAYRVPLPGLERRVAAPSGGGTAARVGQ